jgi:LPS sulfotransferase NodH
VAQAVSLVIAQQTSAWISFQSPQQQPVYDAAAITAALASIDNQLGCWQQFFTNHGLQPLRLDYDKLVLDPRGSVDRVLDHCGLAAADLPSCDSLLPERQTSSVNQAWAERFRTEQLATSA